MQKDTFENRLDALGKEAFLTAKRRLRLLGGAFVLPEPVSLFIDTGEEGDFVHELKAHKAVLQDDNLVILAEMEPSYEQEVLSDADLSDWISPEEYWCEGGEWYAEWEGLLKLIDIIPEN